MNTEASERFIPESLIDRKIKQEVYDFPLGCSTIDIWIKDKFYVAPIDPDSIGLF